MLGDIGAFGAGNRRGAFGVAFNTAGMGHNNDLRKVKNHANTGSFKLPRLFSRPFLQLLKHLERFVDVDFMLGESMRNVLEGGH